jgi:hypothetical protein
VKDLSVFLKWYTTCMYVLSPYESLLYPSNVVKAWYTRSLLLRHSDRT